MLPLCVALTSILLLVSHYVDFFFCAVLSQWSAEKKAEEAKISGLLSLCVAWEWFTDASGLWCHSLSVVVAVCCCCASAGFVRTQAVPSWAMLRDCQCRSAARAFVEGLSWRGLASLKWLVLAKLNCCYVADGAKVQGIGGGCRLAACLIVVMIGIW